MTEQQAMRMALEALERSVATCFDQYAHEQVMSRPEHFVNQAITALLQALEQQHDEPVAWMWYVNNGAGYVSRGIGFHQTNIPFAKHTPLYTRPQPADELLRLRDLLGKANALARIRANEIESLKAKLKEKNT